MLKNYVKLNKTYKKIMKMNHIKQKYHVKKELKKKIYIY